MAPWRSDTQIGPHAEWAGGCQSGQFRPEPAFGIKQCPWPVGPHPILQQKNMIRLVHLAGYLPALLHA